MTDIICQGQLIYIHEGDKTYCMIILEPIKINSLVFKTSVYELTASSFLSHPS